MHGCLSRNIVIRAGQAEELRHRKHRQARYQPGPNQFHFRGEGSCDGPAVGAEFERQNKVLENPAVNEYVNRLGQNIALNSDARIPLTFKVIETTDIDSKALPGGFVYVTTGMILAIDTEAELASVLAQEVAHIAARHGVENVSKVQLVNNASSSLASFVRQQVLEADYLGLQYLYKAGYTPEAANGLLRKIQVRIPGSEFPRIEDRIATNQKNIDLILPPRVQNTVTTPEFDSIKAQLR